jgi:hypothetical protein
MTFTHKQAGIGFLLALSFSILAQSTLAQGGATGAISGAVQDTSGAAIPAAAVRITSNSTGETARDVVTDSDGSFSAGLLPVGSYTLEISKTGFAPAKINGVIVSITGTTRMTVTLKVAAVAQEVIVSAQVQTIDTTAATTGESLSHTSIVSLPLATRNFQQLLALSAGVSAPLNSASQLGRGAVTLNVNGGREDNNNYLIEGISASDYAIGELTNTPLPNPEATQEFKVSTSLYDASQGRNGGGNIEATLKSGTSEFHGDAWEYFRNTVLDASDFFLNAAGRQRPDLKQNTFGADFGGPVPKNLGFFYLNYQGTRQRSGDSPGTFIGTNLPILPQARDNATLISTFFTGPNCPGLPPGVTSLDPVVLALLQAPGTQFGGAGGGFLIPSLPGTAGCSTTMNPNGSLNTVLNTAPFFLSRPGRFRDDQMLANWESPFRGGKDRVAERFFWSDSDTFEPFGADNFGIQTGGQPFASNLNFPLEIPLRGRFGSIAWTHAFGANIVNDFRFGVNITNTEFDNVPIISAAQLGITRPSNNGTPDIYRFALANFQIGSFPNQLQKALTNTLVWNDTVSWTRGRHGFRFGGEVNHTSIRRSLPVASNGLLQITPTTGAMGQIQFTDFQNMMLGSLGSAGFGLLGSGVGTHDYRVPAAALYALDDYRIRSDLTLNVGVRIEFVGAPYDTDCHIGNTDPRLASTGQPFFWPRCVNKFNLPGLVGTAPRTATNNTYATVPEPRIGFAYDLFGHHNTSIRGGYGIYSVREDLGAVDNLSFVPPFLPTAVVGGVPPGSFPNLFAGLVPPLGVLSGTAVPVPSFLQGFPASCTLASGAPSTDPTQCTPIISGNVPTFFGLQVLRKWIVPTTQQWNLTVQRLIGKDWFAEVGYLGSVGHHLRATSDPNEARLASPQHPIVVTAQNGTPFPPITSNTIENAAARAPFLPLSPGGFEGFLPNSDSNYNAFLLTVTHHFSHGLSFQSAYTWSKSIDDDSTSTVAFDTFFNDQLNPRGTRGLSDFDRRHRWVTSFVYQLPFFAHAGGFKGRALGDWQVSGVLTLQSGTPFTPIDSAGGSAYALSSPNLVTPTFAPGFSCANAASRGGTDTESRLNGLLNLDAFQADPLVGPDATGFGNVPRNCFTGPRQLNMDFSVAKIFRLTERQKLRFGADFFNLTNHPSFTNSTQLDIEGGPTGINHGSRAFAPITQTVGTPRLIQFSLKYMF